MNRNILFISDPISNFDLEAETTLFLMHEGKRRGYGIFQTGLPELYFEEGEVRSRSRSIELRLEAGRFHVSPGEVRATRLRDFSFVFLRKDPPVDQAYIYHLQLLSLLEGKVLLINRPSGILAANEKILPLQFPELCPETVLTSNPDVFTQFLRKHKEVVIKPLNLSGGRGVYRLSLENIKEAIEVFETETETWSEYKIVQRFLPEAVEGDKRVLICGDRVLGVFIRVPKAGDFLCNLHQGGSFHPTSLTPKEEAVVARILPELKRLGLLFVGIDLIGGFLTEINSTSPMGLRELNSLYHQKSESSCFDVFENLPSISHQAQ